MKIGMVSKYPQEQDGIAIYTESLCSELENCGIRVVKIGDVASTTADYRIDFKSFSLRSRLRDITKKEELDLLHIQYIPPYFGKFTLNLNLILALSQNVPVIVTLHEVHTEYGTLREKILGLIQKALVKRASAVITHTRQQKEFLQIRYNKRHANVVPMGITLEPMHKLHGKNILCFGMLNYGKGFEYLVRALEEMPDYSLTVAGKGVSDEYVSLLRKAAANNKFGNVKLDVRWIPDDEKRKYFEAADVMVFPYVWAPYQSAAMHDAFSYGIPVVVTDAGPIGEVVKEFICGRVVEKRSPKALAAGIRAVYGNYATYQHGVDKYRQQANWLKAAKKHAELYNETLQRHYDEHGTAKHELEEKKQAQVHEDENAVEDANRGT